MANQNVKITQLPAGTPDSTDVIPFVDVSTGETKKGLKSELKGDTGTAATATAGTTTTGASGTNANVVNSGTTSAAVFDFTIPQGPQGIQGPQGPQGDPGIIQSVVGGTNISVDSTDPANPIINDVSVGTTTSSATPTINTDNVNYYSLTAQAEDITSFTTNLSGTPTEGQTLWISITGTAARAITWGASFEASTVALPTTTVTTARLDVGFVWNSATSKWRCVAVA